MADLEFDSKSKKELHNEDYSAQAVADYLDHGAAEDFPNDPEAQQQAAMTKLYIAVEENLYKNAPRPQKPECAPFGPTQGYDPENPYGYCGKDGVNTTDRFLEEVRKLEKPGVGLALKLDKDDQNASYKYEPVFEKK